MFISTTLSNIVQILVYRLVLLATQGYSSQLGDQIKDSIFLMPGFFGNTDYPMWKFQRRQAIVKEHLGLIYPVLKNAQYALWDVQNRRQNVPTMTDASIGERLVSMVHNSQFCL